MGTASDCYDSYLPHSSLEIGQLNHFGLLLGEESRVTDIKRVQGEYWESSNSKDDLYSLSYCLNSELPIITVYQTITCKWLEENLKWSKYILKSQQKPNSWYSFTTSCQTFHNLEMTDSWTRPYYQKQSLPEWLLQVCRTFHTLEMTNLLSLNKSTY